MMTNKKNNLFLMLPPSVPNKETFAVVGPWISITLGGACGSSCGCCCNFICVIAAGVVVFTVDIN